MNTRKYLLLCLLLNPATRSLAHGSHAHERHHHTPTTSRCSHCGHSHNDDDKDRENDRREAALVNAVVANVTNMLISGLTLAIDKEAQTPQSVAAHSAVFVQGIANIVQQAVKAQLKELETRSEHNSQADLLTLWAQSLAQPWVRAAIVRQIQAYLQAEVRRHQMSA